MRFEDVSTLLTPEKLPYPSGVERLADGVLHVAVLTRMPGVAPEMIRWWFGEYMETTAHYRRWHPRDHVWMSWEDKRPGTHVGASHLVHEFIGERLNELRITFSPPKDFFGPSLGNVPGAVAICGISGLLKRPVSVGRLVHLALPRSWGCELHSRFWLGTVASRDGSRLAELVGNLRFARHVLTPTSLGRSLAVHCHEEMTILAGFLPELYASESRGGVVASGVDRMEGT